MRSLTVYSLILIAALIASTTNAAQKGEFRLTVVDEQSGQPIACRMHLKNARGIPQKAGRQPFLKDHFVFDGKVTLSLREGNYKFEAESGPEYHTRGGHFSVNRFSSDQKTISMRRFADLAKEGWWSGDMYVNRSPRDIELLMRAEDLHVAQLLGWPSRKSDRDTMNSGSPIVKLADSRYYHKLAGRDVRAGGGICFFKLDAVPEIFANGKLANEFPPAVELAQDLKKQGARYNRAQLAILERRYDDAFADLDALVASGAADRGPFVHAHVELARMLRAAGRADDAAARYARYRELGGEEPLVPR